MSSLLAIVASIWSYRTHSMTLYGDSRAHLDVARHVVDGLKPGPTQLGSVWLPLPHILLVPLVAIRPLWHNGVAGAIVGGVCFVYACARLHGLTIDLTGQAMAAWVAVAVFATNLNLLYLQSTALTEPLLLAFIIGAAAHLARWLSSGSARDLGWTALLALCATMSRYEGWVLLAAIALVVVIWGIRQRLEREQVEANVVLFVAVGAFGIALWVLYNLIIFHDPLYFVHSSFSAQSQQVALAQTGQLGTKGNLIESVLTYGWAIIGVLGPVLAVVGLVAAVVSLAVPSPDRRRWVTVLLVLAAPPAFDVISLWMGQSTVRVPQRPPYGMWNDRYGLMALPFVALAIGLLASRARVAIVAMGGVVALALVVAATGTPLTLKDGRTGTSSAAGGRPELAAAYLSQHYRGGEVLADDASAAPLMFATGLDLSEFVTIGFHPYFEEAMRSPGTTVRWVIAYDGDAVDTDMKADPSAFERFSLVLHDDRVRLYERST